MNRFRCALTFAFVVATMGWAQTTVDLSDVLQGRELLLPADTLPDPSSQWTPNQAISSRDWHLLSGKAVESYGLEPGTRWFRTTLVRSPAENRSFALVSWGTLLNHLDVSFFDAQGNLLASYLSGDSANHDARLPQSLAFSFPVPPLPEVQVLIRIETKGSTVYQMYLWESVSLQRNLELQNLLLGFLFGFLFMMAVINVLFRFSLRDTRFLWYAGYLVALSFFLMVYSGWLRFLALPQRFLQDVWDIGSLAPLLIVAVWFGRRACRLESVKGSLVFTWAVSAVAIGGTVVAFLGWKDEGLLVLNVDLAVMALGSLGFIAAQGLRGDRFSRVFLVAWSMPLFSVFLIVVQAVFASSWSGPNPYYLFVGGILIEVLLLSFAFSDEIHRWQRIVQTRLDGAYRMDRLSALGLVSAQLGHEINTPNHILGLDLTHLEAVAMGTLPSEDPQDDKQALVTMRSQIKELLASLRASQLRISQVAEQLLLGRSAGLGPSTHVGLSAVVDQTVRLHGARWEALGTIVWSRPPSDVLISGHANRVEQLVVNLVDNALRSLTRPTQSVRIVLEAVGENARLTVADEGCGMDAAQVALLGVPFVTGRAGRGGHGLGWGICQDIAREHGGRLEVSSTVGVGTTVVFTAPRVTDSEFA